MAEQLGGRLRRALPEPVRERARLGVAAVLEQRSRRAPEVRGAALVFHAVASRGGDPQLEIEPAISTATLDALAGYVSRRYSLVRAGELPSAAAARTAGDRIPIALTFDDDLPSHLEQAAPVLDHHGAVATAFLCGARAPFWWQLLQAAVDEGGIAETALPGIGPDRVRPALERRPGAIRRLAAAVEALSPADRGAVTEVLSGAVSRAPRVLGPEGARALAEAGWEIGFHTRDHHPLPALDDDALRRAIEPQPVGAGGPLPRTLAYPHGKAGPREADATRRAGYVAAYTGRPTVFERRTDPHLIGRLQPDTTTVGRFAVALARAISGPGSGRRALGIRGAAPARR